MVWYYLSLIMVFLTRQSPLYTISTFSVHCLQYQIQQWEAFSYAHEVVSPFACLKC